MSKTVAIMQPTYLPWLGYLAMVNKVDQFVLLDNVQFDHRSWQQRNRIKTLNGALWLTISVKQKGEFKQKINDVMSLDIEKDVKKHLSSISHSYRKSVSFDDFYKPFSDAMILNAKISGGNIAAFNINLIKFLCDYAGLKSNFISSSTIPVSGQKDGLLANICEYLNADRYLSPDGSRIYLDESSEFKEKKIEIAYHNYVHPVYPQLFGDFEAGMSCVDAFFNVKKEDLKTTIISGCL